MPKEPRPRTGTIIPHRDQSIRHAVRYDHRAGFDNEPAGGGAEAGGDDVDVGRVAGSGEGYGGRDGEVLCAAPGEGLAVVFDGTDVYAG